MPETLKNSLLLPRLRGELLLLADSDLLSSSESDWESAFSLLSKARAVESTSLASL